MPATLELLGNTAMPPPAEAFVLATAAVSGGADSNGLGDLVNGIAWDEFGYRV